MKKSNFLIICLAIMVTVTFLTSCSKKDTSDEISVVWLPDNSLESYDNFRAVIDETITRATGKKCRDIFTTDYAIVVETLANNKAAICYAGAQSYIDVHAKNDQIVPLVVRSGVSGTADDAMYYSWISVDPDKIATYRKADGSINPKEFEQKRISFVSGNSTSGFTVPANFIISAQKDIEKWTNLTSEDIMEGGKDKLFSEVTYGGTHQITLLNLLLGRCDIAATCNISTLQYSIEKGTANTAGAVYRIADDSQAPFDTVAGKEFALLEAIPVMNFPLIMNKNLLTDKEQQDLLDYFTSDEVANDERMFPTEKKEGSNFAVKRGNERFVHVDDAWFDPLRNISK
jgi:phosphonate transport system substrate-binding protein